VPQQALARIPDALSFEEAAPLMCAGITTFNALRNSGARAGNTVAVQGICGLGHLAVQFASKMGFGPLRSRAEPTSWIWRRSWVRMNILIATRGTRLKDSRPNGRLILFAHDVNPLIFPIESLLFGRKAVVGWYSGHAKDSEETLAFAVLRGVRPMVELFPLEEAEKAFEHIGKARFRAVLKV
jgi:D-arabinose 1-dehydrogenase-like Zn-dependent alcohol dehydrogenase